MALDMSKSIEAGLQALALEEDSQPEQSKLAKLKTIFTNITVEPILVLYVMPSIMVSLAVQNLSLEKACRVNLQLDVSVCDALSTRNSSAYNQSDEIAVQRLVSTMYIWKNMVQSIVPAVLLMFWGSWSDRNQKRKPCMILPTLGEIITSLGFILATYIFYELPMEFNAFIETIPPAITGGWFVMFMAIFSYISGITTVKTRTLRIGAANMFFNISLTIGIALSGVLYREIGFYGVFSLAIAMDTVAVLYAILFVKEIPREEKINTTTTNAVKDFFDLKHIKETFKVAFKSGQRNRKKRICAIMVLVMVIVGPMHGEISISYLFTRYKFGWNEIDYSFFSTFQFIILTIFTLVSLSVFSKYLKMDDALVGIISTLSKIAGCIVYAFAPNATIFYLGAIIEGFNGTSFIAMRSIMSKLVPADELGKLNSLFGVSEALMPLVYGPMYNIIYKNTINVLPGTFYLVGGFLTTPAVIIFFWLYREHLNDKKELEMEKAQSKKLLND